MRSPPLTDEQVREIAKKYSAIWNDPRVVRYSVKEAIESAIREAMGRGERG